VRALLLSLLLSACGQDAMGPAVVEVPEDPCELDATDPMEVEAWAEVWVDEGSCVVVKCPGAEAFGACNGGEVTN